MCIELLGVVAFDNRNGYEKVEFRKHKGLTMQDLNFPRSVLPCEM